MKLQDQVSSLELSKRLKELGVKQESFWCWVEDERKSTEFPAGWILENTQSIKSINIVDFYSAFTVAELGEMLPEELRKDNVHLSLLIQKIHIGNKKFPDYGKWGVCYLNMPSSSNVLHSEVDTEADARAKMLIYLIENKLVDVKTLTNQP